MATYAELRTAAELPSLLIQVQVACVVAANTVALEAPATPLHTQRMLWAADVFANPVTAAQRMVWSVLAKNAAATPAQIANATDATVQTNVNDSVNVFANTYPAA
jgi:hypothetical protein